MRSHLTLLLLAFLPHLTLTLPSPPQLAPRQLQPPNLPLPTGETPTTCPPNPPNTNLFTLHKFLPVHPKAHHRPDTHPDPDTPPTDPHPARRSLAHICHQVAGFAFPALGATTVKTQDVLLQPRTQHVFSVAADAVVQGIVAWAWEEGYQGVPGGRARHLGTARPGQNAGTLVVAGAEVAVRVFFVVTFSRVGCQGEVGLFALGAV